MPSNASSSFSRQAWTGSFSASSLNGLTTRAHWKAPNYADYIVFGAFQWARVVSPFKLLAEEDPVYAWREKLLDAFDGMARQSPGYPV